MAADRLSEVVGMAAGRLVVVGCRVEGVPVVARVPPLQALAWRAASWAWFRSTRRIVR